tara:strand:+ start:1517 stop:2146 length:630 start_codon:yes stop_codon:yes gene_type:complete
MKTLKALTITVLLIASNVFADDSTAKTSYSDNAKKALTTESATTIVNGIFYSVQQSASPSHKEQLSRAQIKKLHNNRLPENFTLTMIDNLNSKHSLIKDGIKTFSLHYVIRDDMIDIQLCWIIVANNKRECLLSDKSNAILEHKDDKTYGAIFMLHDGMWVGYADGDLLFRRTSPRALIKTASDAWIVMKEQLIISINNGERWADYFKA